MLSPHEALDPKGEHPERFCDYAVRAAQAAEMAKAVPKDRLGGVATADMRFSYPIFDRNLTHAVLQHTGSNQIFLRNGTRTVPAASFRNIYLTKKNGAWTARFELLGVT